MELVSELHTSREDMGQKSQQSPDEPCEERLFCRPHWPCLQGDRDALTEPSLVRRMPVGSGMMEPQELPVHLPAVGSNYVHHGRG